MKKTFLPLALPAVALAACSSTVTPTKLQQVTDGMNTGQVESLLGQPARIDQAEITGLTGQVYHYLSPQGDACVVFLNGTVFQTRYDNAQGSPQKISTGGHA